MKITIIEDCSPYYIRFLDSDIDQIFSICDNEIEDKKFYFPFTHYIFSKKNALRMKEKCELFKIFDLDLRRISMFVSRPGLYYQAHKDGLNAHFSLNYTYKVLDDKCVTNWYSDEECKNYTIGNFHLKSRECLGFDPTKHTPIKSMTAKPNELILFNTELYHDWSNKESKNIRMILTLRLRDYSKENTMFEDAKEKLFELI